MPLTRMPARCWILNVPTLWGEEDWHTDSLDTALTAVAEAWAARPGLCPPVPWQDDLPCLLVQCRVCGNNVGDGEHFADGEHALEAAECDGWQDDLCPFCQPVETPV